MANKIYPKAKETAWQGGINLLTDTIKIALVDTGTYTYSDAHQFYSSVSAAVVGTPQTLSGKSLTGGMLKASGVTFPSVTGPTAEALVVYKDTGSAATSNLIAYIDTGQDGLPFTPNGGNANFTPDPVNGLFTD